MAETIRDFIGGPLHGESRVVSEASVGLTVPVLLSNGRPLDPPRWAQYKLRADNQMHYVCDGDMTACLAASLRA